jgi:hypothetical protein
LATPAARSHQTGGDDADAGDLPRWFSGGQRLAEQVPERRGSSCFRRSQDTVTALRQSQCDLSGLIIRWGRFNAPRVRGGKEAVAVQADMGGAQLLPQAPARNPEAAHAGHVTDPLRDFLLRASGPCTLTWMPGVDDSAAVEGLTGCVPVRGADGQPALALQRARPGALALSTVAGQQEACAWVLGCVEPLSRVRSWWVGSSHMQAPARRVAHV